MTGIRVIPVKRDDANRYVEALHRHNGRLPSGKFQCAAIDNSTGRVVGVAMAGNPKGRGLDDGFTLEVSRVCSDGSRNVCSKLYGACVRAARALGYWRIFTYTLESEAGASLRASGWRLDAEIPGRSWELQSGRVRGGLATDGIPKNRWSILLAQSAPPPLIWPKDSDLGQYDMLDLAAWETS